jgi:hypothetical protein
MFLLKLKTRNNAFPLLFLLSFWTALLHTVLVADIPKECLFRLEETVAASGAQVEFVFELVPDSYLLKVKHNSQPNQSKDVVLNGAPLSAFKVLKENSSSSSRLWTEKVTDYFYISPNQIRKNNSLKINFHSGFPEKVRIKFRNYRGSFLNDNVIVFFKQPPACLFKSAPLQLIFTFVSTYFLFVIISILAGEAYKKAAVYMVFCLDIFFSAIAVNNFLPFTLYTVCINFWFWLVLIASFILLVGIYKRYEHDVRKESVVNDLPASNIQPATALIFCCLLLLLFTLRLVLVLDNRIPMGHDTFQYLQLQYNVFFNEVALNGNVPRWLPFMTHGTVSNTWMIISQGLLTSALVPFVRFLQRINFFYIFQASLLFDELVLLVGCILLAKRYFKSVATILFVASSVTFTAVSSTQIWWDFHLIYLFPLTLYCLDRALREVSAQHLFLGGLFSVGMLLGNPPYCGAIFAFSMSVLGLTICIYSVSQTSGQLKRFFLGFRWRHLLAMVVPCGLAMIVLLFVRQGIEDVVAYNTGRSADWSVNSVRDFLGHGGYVNLHKYLEFVSRGSNNIDNTIYAGLLLVPFIVLTLLRVRSRLSYVFGTTTVIMALFSAGLFVPLVFYYCFPFAKYYRHIGLIAPLVKVFAIFYAGFGFDLFWRRLRDFRHDLPQGTAGKNGINLCILSAVMLYIFIFALAERFIVFSIFDFGLWSRCRTENQFCASQAQICSVMDQVLVISAFFMMLLLAALRWPKRARLIGLILISTHLIDVGSFKVQSEYRRVPRVNKDVVSLFRAHEYAFCGRRSQDYFSNERFCKLVPFLFYEDKRPFDTNQPADVVGKYGVQYWSIDCFLFLDPVSHIFRTEYWLKGIDAFYRAWTPVSARVPYHAGFPIPEAAAFKNLCGYHFPKLQLFSKIHVVSTEEDVAEVLANSDFRGGVLLSSYLGSELPRTGVPVVIGPVDDIALQANERIAEADVSAQEFTFNKVTVLVNNDTGIDAMLYYADAWHPKWHAYVDGKPVFIFKSNLGYKSVIIPPGESEVVFEFGDAATKLLFHAIVAIGICVFCCVIYCIFVGLRK